MRFRDQMEQLIQCKVSGMCARDQLTTEYLKKRGDSFFDLLALKQADDVFAINLIKALLSEERNERK